MAETIRDIIKREMEALREIDTLGPVVASEKLVSLSSLLSSLNNYIVEKKYWLNVLKAKLLVEHKTVAKSKLMADATPEWKELAEAEGQQEALMESLRAIKYYLKASGQELNEFTKHQ